MGNGKEQMMLARFFAPDLDLSAADVRLPPEESHHLLHVLRLNTGDDVAVFDGRGREVRARISSVARDRVRAEILEPLSPAREPAVALTLVQAVLKGDKMESVVRDATMMGVVAIEPVVTQRTLVKVAALGNGRVAERWRRVAVASAKQCRRAVVPRIGVGVRFDHWAQGAQEGLKLLLVEPSAAAHADSGTYLATLARRARPPSVAVIVGPEGGWTDDERQRAVAGGCVPVTLGSITFRADAMALCALAIVRFALGDL